MISNNRHNQLAFSMIELIFVIVILGIVASIGSQIIVNVYENYITQRALHTSSIKTELASTQMVNRLTYSIPGTIIGRKSSNISSFKSIRYIPAGSTDYDILEWIAYDADSFGAITGAGNIGKRPIWSGYCDVEDSNLSTLSTPGSRLSKLSAIINALSPSTKSISDTAIFFPELTAHTVGYSGTGSTSDNVHTVSNNNGNTKFILNAKANRTIKEHYKLAWTAYAIVPTNPHTMEGAKDTHDVYDLELWYDYQPWNGDSYKKGSHIMLVKDVSVFKFTGKGNTIRIKICQRENIGQSFTINTCKEKAIIR